jgi:hypothetical protein
MRVLIALLVWAAAIAGGIGVSSVVADSIHTNRAAAAAANIDVSTIIATDSKSLFTTANFSTALSAATKKLGPNANVSNFVVYPGYLSITANTGSSSVDLYVSATGTVDTTSLSSASPGDTVFPLSQINASDLSVLAQRIATKADVPESQLHYFVAQVSSTSKNPQWLVYCVQASSVEYFQAKGPRGRLLEYPKNGATGLIPVKR